MRRVAPLAIVAALAGLAARGAAAPLPAHTDSRVLSSGALSVEVMDPGAAGRYYRGTRFSNVGMILRGQLDGKEFFYSPIPGTDGGGSAMEFDIGEGSQNKPPGYAEAVPNGAGAASHFIKVGVGVLSRNTSNNYAWGHNYPVIERAPTAVTWGPSSATFLQTTAGANGYDYELEETITLSGNRIVLDFRLRNTGTKPFTTEQYLHNFMRFENQNVGPNYTVSFPYDFTLTGASPQFQRSGNSLVFHQELSGSVKPWAMPPGGYTGPNSLTVTQSEEGMSMTIDSSLPSNGVAIYATREQLSPEMYSLITLGAGEQITFSRTYTLVPEPAAGAGVLVGAMLCLLPRRGRVLAPASRT